MLSQRLICRLDPRLIWNEEVCVRRLHNMHGLTEHVQRIDSCYLTMI